MKRLFGELSFRDPARTRRELDELGPVLPGSLRSRAEFLLAASPDPESAIGHLAALHERQPQAFGRLTRSVAGLRRLIAVFSHSRFLAEEVIEHPEWLDEPLERDGLDRALSTEELRERLEAFLGASDGALPSALSLALFRRKQILRVLLRDVLGLGGLSEVTGELSNLADAILDVACRSIRDGLAGRFGRPLCVGSEQRLVECGFAVIALGKLGGEELNYSSDIDLMFLYTGAGETDGAARISNKEFFKRVANQLTALLSTYTPEGLCYRVDLRLRPDGRLGEVCISLEGAKQYYRTRARDWELQMLIKGRVAAGDIRTGRELLEFVEPLTYSTTLDFSAVETMSETRERLNERLAAKKLARKAVPGEPPPIDVKLARGGIRDIEFLVQCLQRLHGGREPWVRHGGTLLALSRLRDKNLLSDAEYGRLAAGYQFLRHLEHRLQFAEDRQTHTLPVQPGELDLVARRMPSGQIGPDPSAAELLRRLNAHLEEVVEIYERVVHAHGPAYYGPAPAVSSPVSVEPSPAEPALSWDGPAPPSSNIVRFLGQRAPALGAALARANLRRGFRNFEHFLERIADRSELDRLDRDPVLARHAFDLFEHSPYFAEQLIRNPELLDEVGRASAPAGAGPSFPYQGLFADPTELRRFFRREMLRIQCESICLHSPIFHTLGLTSDLADTVIAAAYSMAVDQVLAIHPPDNPFYTPGDQMMIICLGRLGLREFDVASDADLVFVLPDRDSAEQMFWTRVAERLIDLLTAYTGEGVLFAVDTRLRPNGRAGALVQTAGNYRDYFARSAEAWEGITYMKSRAVAGNPEDSTEFLHELQEVDWRRYGQSGRSRKDLRQMRLRLEKEQGAGNPLKAGRGGYYDIDFVLMYLRLKSAGIFFKVLNTPERIDIIEKMGHLDRADAEFLRDAATFYRALDHGLRVLSGHAEGRLPSSEAQVATLTGLVCRWTPDHLHDQPLHDELAQIRDKTREVFDRLFE